MVWPDNPFRLEMPREEHELACQTNYPRPDTSPDWGRKGDAIPDSNPLGNQPNTITSLELSAACRHLYLALLIDHGAPLYQLLRLRLLPSPLGKILHVPLPPSCLPHFPFKGIYNRLLMPCSNLRKVVGSVNIIIINMPACFGNGSATLSD